MIDIDGGFVAQEAHMAEEELKDIQEEFESVSVVNGKVVEQEQPALWRSHGMLVVDPFIRVKVMHISSSQQGRALTSKYDPRTLQETSLSRRWSCSG